MEDKIKAFIGKAEFDKEGGFIWGVQPNGTREMIAEIRGWGSIQRLFPPDKAERFQDAMGEMIANAINETLNKV
jgi:hypothetical protein